MRVVVSPRPRLFHRVRPIAVVGVIGVIGVIAACGPPVANAPAPPSRVRPVSNAARFTDTRIAKMSSPSEPERVPESHPPPWGCHTLIELAGDTMTIRRAGRPVLAVPRTGGAYRSLSGDLDGTCMVTISAHEVPYAMLVSAMDAVSRAGVGDIVVGADSDTESLSLPAPPGSRYRHSARRSAKLDRRSPVIILGPGGLTYQAHADDIDTATLIAAVDDLDETAPYKELYHRLMVTRSELPENATTLILKADGHAASMAVTRALAAARSAGFVDVLFSSRE